MKIAITQFVSLDGVSQGPGSADEDATDGFTRGGWLVPHMNHEFIELASDSLDNADGLLLGRRTYEAFARDWPEITDPGDPFTGRMNSLPKYVVSTTLKETPWNPTTHLGGDLESAVAELKQKPGREVQVHGSARLAGSLLAAGLVDTLRLFVAPTVVGAGRRLLSESPRSTGLELQRSVVTAPGVVFLEYSVSGEAATADWEGVAAVSG